MRDTTSVTLPRGWTISPRLVPCWHLDDDHTLEIAPSGRTDDDRIRWSYRLAKGNRTIFAGSDIGSPAGARFDTEQLIAGARAVLSFLTLQPGDTDADHFDDYTPEQLGWCDAHAAALSVLAMDDQCGYCGSHEHTAPGCTRR